MKLTRSRSRTIDAGTPGGFASSTVLRPMAPDSRVPCASAGSRESRRWLNDARSSRRRRGSDAEA
jgi:hypothetical protein